MGAVVAVIDGERNSRISLFFVIDITFKAWSGKCSQVDESREIKTIQMRVRYGVKRFNGA